MLIKNNPNRFQKPVRVGVWLSLNDDALVDVIDGEVVDAAGEFG